MLKGLAKLLAYKNAPKSTFALLHPLKALKWGAALYLVGKLLGLGRDKEERQKEARR